MYDLVVIKAMDGILAFAELRQSVIEKITQIDARPPGRDRVMERLTLSECVRRIPPTVCLRLANVLVRSWPNHFRDQDVAWQLLAVFGVKTPFAAKRRARVIGQEFQSLTSQAMGILARASVNRRRSQSSQRPTHWTCVTPSLAIRGAMSAVGCSSIAST